jgi:hypothetical protein
MSSRHAILSCLVLSCAAVCAGTAHADGAPWGLAELMQRFHAVTSSQAHFVERRYLGMLSEPLKSSGKLAYSAPDRLEKITLTPQPERLSLDGDRLTIDRGSGDHGSGDRGAGGQGLGGEHQTLALSAHPEIAGVVESIRGTLAGDQVALERFYTVGLTGDEHAWTLRLDPKDTTLRKLVSRITIAGSGAAIHTIDTREGDGDHTEMIILDDPQ